MLVIIIVNCLIMKTHSVTKGIAIPTAIALTFGLLVLIGVIYYNSQPQGEIMKEMGKDMAEEGKVMMEEGEDMMKGGEAMIEEGEKMMGDSGTTIEEEIE